MDVDRRARALAVGRETLRLIGHWLGVLALLFVLYVLRARERGPAAFHGPDPHFPVIDGPPVAAFIDWIWQYSTLNWGVTVSTGRFPGPPAALFGEVLDAASRSAVLLLAVAIAVLALLGPTARLVRRAVAAGRRRELAAITSVLGTTTGFLFAYPLLLAWYHLGLGIIHLPRDLHDASLANVGFLVVLAVLVALPLVAHVARRYLRTLSGTSGDGTLPGLRESGPYDVRFLAAYCLGSVFLVEIVLDYPGLGYLTYRSANPYHLPVLFAALVGFAGTVLLVRWLWNVLAILRADRLADAEPSSQVTATRPSISEFTGRAWSSRKVRQGVLLLGATLLFGGASAVVLEPELRPPWQEPATALLSGVHLLDAIGTVAVLATTTLATAVLVGVLPSALVALRRARHRGRLGELGRVLDGLASTTSFFPVVVVGIAWLGLARPAETDVAFAVHAGAVGGLVVGAHAYRATAQEIARRGDATPRHIVAGVLGGVGRLATPVVSVLTFVAGLSLAGVLGAETSISRFYVGRGDDWTAGELYLLHLALLFVLLVPAAGVYLLTDGCTTAADAGGPSAPVETADQTEASERRTSDRKDVESDA